jgi:predicted PurR-regulated permease PerM
MSIYTKLRLATIVAGALFLAYRVYDAMTWFSWKSGPRYNEAFAVSIATIAVVGALVYVFSVLERQAAKNSK